MPNMMKWQGKHSNSWKKTHSYANIVARLKKALYCVSLVEWSRVEKTADSGEADKKIHVIFQLPIFNAIAKKFRDARRFIWKQTYVFWMQTPLLFLSFTEFTNFLNIAKANLSFLRCARLQKLLCHWHIDVDRSVGVLLISSITTCFCGRKTTKFNFFWNATYGHGETYPVKLKI